MRSCIKRNNLLKQESEVRVVAKLPDIKIKVNCDELDKAIEKANRLAKLLREAKQIIDSLGRGLEA